MPISREDLDQLLREFVEHIAIRRVDQLEQIIRQDSNAMDAQIGLLRDRVSRLEGARESDTIHTGNTGRFRLSEMPKNEGRHHSGGSLWPKAMISIIKPALIPIAAAVGGFITHWILKH